ncbi:cingulin-like [Poecilia reticulata]|uniref:cingulin-like n=1 Tax=Poecilia reticulata TaxID=8081 RepID=UPI0004A343D1|nr:PREDICTED: cingulin-like [Poecilia reticulata]
MAKPLVYHLNNELFDIFQQEIKELHQDVAAITMEKLNTECYYEDIVSEERKEKQALLLEIQELKEKLEKAESKNQGQVGRDETTCCPTIQELQQEMKEMEKKHCEEIEMLTIEFEIDVAAAQKEVKKLQKKLKNERNLGAKSNSAKREAINILLKFPDHCEGLKNVSTGKSTEIIVRDEDIPYLDVQQLQEMLQRERKLRMEAENENLDQFKIAEAFFDMMEQELKTERERRAQIEADKEEAVEIAEQLIKKLEDVEKTSKEGPDETTSDERDKTQLELQQLEKMLQEEKTQRAQAENLLELLEQEVKSELERRAQIETDKEEAVEIAEQLIKKLEEVEKTSKEVPSQTALVDKIQLELQQLEKMLQEEKSQRVQAENLLEILEEEVKTEQEHRAQIEAEKEGAVEIAAQLIKKLENVEKTSETALDDRNKFEMELQQLEKMLKEEKRLRLQGETENASLLKTVESLRQETDKELQKERALREEAERGKLELEQVSDNLYQGLEKACKMTETLSAEAELLSNKLQAEDKKGRSLLKDIQELTLILEKEKALRIEAENYEMEAMEMLEAFQKEAEC